MTGFRSGPSENSGHPNPGLAPLVRRRAESSFRERLPIDRALSFAARLLAAALMLSACGPFGPAALSDRADGRFQDPAIQESSGIVKSRQFDGVFWTLNDSGNPLHLYAFDPKGGRIGTIDVAGATNVDWEDMTADDAGFLYICDIGNNRNRREEFTIYQVREVDPRRASQATVSTRFTFQYPEFRSPNAEACFFHQGSLYILTKEPGDGKTGLYRLRLSDPSDRTTATLAGETRMEEPVTGAALSSDGARLAVLTYASVFLFARPAEGDDFLAGPSCRKAIIFGQAEGIAWDGTGLIVTNEDGHLLHLDGICSTGPPVDSSR